MSQFFLDSDCSKHVRRFEACGSACGAGGKCDLFETHQERFPFYKSQTQIPISRQPFGGMAVDVNFPQLTEDSLLQSFAELDKTIGFYLHFIPGDLTSFAESHNAGNVE